MAECHISRSPSGMTLVLRMTVDELRDGMLVIHLTGTLDLATAPRLEAGLNELLDARTPRVVRLGWLVRRQGARCIAATTDTVGIPDIPGFGSPNQSQRHPLGAAINRGHGRIA